MRKPGARKMWGPGGAIKQNGWMADKWNQAKEYGTMASEKAKEYGSMASQKARDMYNKYSNKEEVASPMIEKEEAEPMMAESAVAMERPKRRRSRRTMKKTMKKRRSSKKRMSGIFDKEDIIPTAAGAGAGAILGGGKGALAGGLIGYGASKLIRRNKD